MEQGEILIDVQNVSKRFCKNLKRSIRYGFMDSLRAIAGRNMEVSHLRKDEFWAVKDVSFQLRRGECLGLIGHNGAGKSTLLKMLNGLIRPDKGQITIRGKIGALIELGAGFNPILTGRENIYNNGAVLGFSRKEIENKVEEIIDFAEIREFIDSPVQNYSSGMRVRLGFAIAAQMEPDVLLVDEVLAVGDMAFAIKSLRRIDELLRNSAVIFVSHSMPHIARISNKISILEKGIQVYYSEQISEGIDYYYSTYQTDVTSFAQTNEIEILKIWFPLNQDEESTYKIPRLDDLVVSFRIKIASKYQTPFLAIVIYDREQRPIGVNLNGKALESKNVVDRQEDFIVYEATLKIPRINLSKGIYSITLAVTEEYAKHFLLRAQNAIYFQVQSEHTVWEPIEFEGVWK